MRAIKFRAWDARRNKYEISRPTAVNGDGVVLLDVCEGTWLDTSLEPEQFTGLHDKNGKEIYEGDIVRVTANPNHGVGVVCFGKYKIDNFTKHDRQQFHLGFYIEYKRKSLSIIHSVETPTGYGSSHHYVEVIGNIHGNPELLEAKP